MRQPRRPRRALLGLSTTVLLGAGILAGCGSTTDAASPSGDSSSSGAAPSGPVDSADLETMADWLSGEVSRKGFVKGQYVDHGLSLDYATALARIGGHDDVVDRILDAMQDPNEVAGYVSFYDEAKNGQYAGATAKLVDTVFAGDRDPADYREDLVADLEDMVVVKGAETGRAKDTGKTDYSNSISQSYVVRALAVAGSDDSLDPAVSFLLSQQCDEGWFRESMTAGSGGDFSCDRGPGGDRTPSVDATAHAVQALLQVRDELDGELADAAEQAGASAIAWLESAQGDDGGYAVEGGGGTPNANSTGLATAALAASGQAEPAQQGTEWLLDHMVPADEDGPLSGEAGAEAFDDRALAKARQRGVKAADRYVWQRATVEAALGLQGVAEE